MKTRISADNPFGRNRYGFLWETLRPEPSGTHLDYGAYDGAVLSKLCETGAVHRGVGVDVNLGVVSTSQHRISDAVQLHTIEKDERLPFDDDSFDSASVLDVIEHVVDQRRILKELHRVVKPGGRLVVTVPGKHLFSFLDIGNFKYRFPRVHKLYYTRKHSAEAYHRRYVECENGLFGDIEVAKGWHQHFAPAELAALLESCGFTDVEFDGCGYAERPLSLMLKLAPRAARHPIHRAIRADSERFHRTHLFSASRNRR